MLKKISLLTVLGLVGGVQAGDVTVSPGRTAAQILVGLASSRDRLNSADPAASEKPAAPRFVGPVFKKPSQLTHAVVGIDPFGWFKRSSHVPAPEQDLSAGAAPVPAKATGPSLNVICQIKGDRITWAHGVSVVNGVKTRAKGVRATKGRTFKKSLGGYRACCVFGGDISNDNSAVLEMINRAMRKAKDSEAAEKAAAAQAS